MKKSLISALLLLLLIPGCAREEKIPPDYVLQIKQVGLRKGVLLRRYRLTSAFGKNEVFTAEMLKGFVQEVLEPDYLLIEDAYRKGIPQEVNIKTDLQEHKIGLLSARHPIHGEQIFISNDELQAFYQKKNTAYDLELIQTPSYYEADSICQSLRAGHNLAHRNGEVEMGYPRRAQLTGLAYGEALHPDVFGALAKMKEGEISAPIYSAPLWSTVVLKKKYANSRLKPYDELKKDLAIQAQALRKFENLRQFIDELKKKHKIEIKEELYPKLINAFVSKMGRSGLDRSRVPESDLAEVFIKVADDDITVERFIAAFNRGREFQTASQLTEQDLSKFIDNLVAQHLLYLDALEKGVDQDELVRDMLENKEHKTLLARYLKQELYDKTTVSDEEAKKHYDLHRDKWSGRYEDVVPSVKDDLKDKLLIEKKNALIERLRDKHEIRYNEPALAELARQLTDEKASNREEK